MAQDSAALVVGVAETFLDRMAGLAGGFFRQNRSEAEKNYLGQDTV
jgi:hypothetical protein